MLDGMTHEQFDEWCAKDCIEPIGHGGTHDILARIGYLVAQFMGAKDVEEKTFAWWREDVGQQQTASEKKQPDGVMMLEALGWKRV
jgi:hypothetical protein